MTAIDPTLAARGRGYAARIAVVAQNARSAEEFLDSVRDIAREEKFLVGLRTLSQALDPAEAGHAYSDLADAIVQASLARVESDFRREYGLVPGGRCVVVGMGKLGSREMTAASDLDLVLAYDFDEDRPEIGRAHV